MSTEQRTWQGPGAASYDVLRSGIRIATVTGLTFTDIGLQQDLEAGLKLAKDIAARKPGLPVLYTTGQGVTDGMRAMFADPFGFLPKPYTPDDLTTALGNLLAIEPGSRAGASGKKERGPAA